MRSLEVVDVSGNTDASVGEDHHVLADPLHIGDHVRRQDHRRTVFGNGAHELSKRSSRATGSEIRDRLIPAGAARAAFRAPA